MDLQTLRQIKKLVIISLFSDDALMDTFVLKGGNALDIVYELTTRPSIDIDISIENDFNPNELGKIQETISSALRQTFSENGYMVFDIKLIEKPKVISTSIKGFWGGYSIKFKVIASDDYDRLCTNDRLLRTRSLSIGKGNKKEIEIQISKYEFCSSKVAKELDGFTIFVYSPEMIVCEKLRSICQQMPEYLAIVNSSTRSPRTQDFYDIYLLMHKYDIDLATPANIELLSNIFHAKRVPLHLIGEIEKYFDYHSSRFEVLQATVNYTLQDFAFYFNYVVGKCKALEFLWNV